MNDLKKEKINELMQLVSKHLNIIRKYGLSQMQFWVIALCIGVASGLATLGFRLAIKYLQLFFYGESGVSLTSAVSELPWFTIVTIPIIGGIIVGLILHFFTKDGRARSVGHVIEGSALYDGRVEGKAGLASCVAALVTLSTGVCTWRVGPVASLGTLIS